MNPGEYTLSSKTLYSPGIVRTCLTILSLILAFPQISLAQTHSSTVNPGQIQQYLQPAAPLPGIEAKPLFNTQEEHKEKPKPTGPSFILKEVDFENLTAFTKEQLQPDYQSYIGKSVTLATLDEIAASITAKYRNAGYILSRTVVPPQKIHDGKVTIRIVEGYVNKVTFEGMSPDYDENSTDLMHQYANKILTAHPLDARTLERYLLLMQDLPGVTVHAIIRPSEDAPGASDIVITIGQKTMNGSVSIDNRQTRFMGPVEGTLTANLNNLFGLYDHTQLHGTQTAEFDQLHYGQIEHDEALDSEGTRLSLTLAYTSTHPGYTLDDLNVEGSDNLFSAAVSHPFIRSRDSNLIGSVQFDVHDTRLDVLDTPLYNDKLRVLRAGGNYEVTDRFNGINILQAQVSQGLPWDSNDNSTSSNAAGRTDFQKVTAQASHDQQIWGPFEGFITAKGQLASDGLLIDEQFAIGGADFGSAYDPAELTGDSGAAARAEFRFNGSTPSPWLPSYQTYLFYDAGVVSNHGGNAGLPSTSLTDAGLGVRYNADKSIFGYLEVAKPLTKAVSAYGDVGYDPRVFFLVGYNY